jgi:hypothetical protein
MVTVILKDGAVIEYEGANEIRPGRDGVDLYNSYGFIAVVSPSNVAGVFVGPVDVKRPDSLAEPS